MPLVIKSKPPVKPAQVEGKKVVIVGHVTESYGPVQALPSYLMKKTGCFGVITHPFSYCSIPSSECSLFQGGERLKNFFGPKYKLKRFFVIHYFGDILLTFYFFIRMAKKWDVYVGCNCLNAFCGVLLKRLKLVKRVIFYENEYIVRRFENVALNFVFQFFNGFVARRADVVWDSPPGLEGLRESQSVIPTRIVRIPHGVDLEKIKVPRETVNRYELVYVGHLKDSKGLQLVISALKEVVKKVSQVKMTIIGSGPSEVELKEMVRKKRLVSHFTFFGYTSHDWTLTYLPKCAVGIAPYAPLDKQNLMYAEPLKVKDYLACGLPVIITSFAELNTKIRENQMGVVIEYEKSQMVKAILRLLTDERYYRQCRKNVLSYQGKISWEETFDQAFAKTWQIIQTG